MTVAVVLVSAGKGARLGASVPKAVVSVAGKTLLELSLIHISEFKPDQLVVVAPEGLTEEFERLTSKFFTDFTVVAGGSTRQQSVAEGLKRVHTDFVLVHDAARAFTPKEVFARVSAALERADCVVPAIQLADTVKQVSGDWVDKTLNRNTLRLIQTPQGFRVATLRDGLERATEDFTDEAGLLESLGIPTSIVEGHEHGFKVTTPSDLERARAIFADVRSGIGVDAHQFSDEGVLMLGCLEWPEYRLLAGHSDGDSVAHAIVDALLGAASLGDIGSNFGVDRPEYSGASGTRFLQESVRMLADAGFEPVNISVQIVADKPKVGPRRQELETRLSEIIGAPVSVLATTTDGLGFLADAKGIAAVATSLVRMRG
ncbi:MAG: 2-C-methyl-D-erythritol 4-phosphate cytidylyltransferase [Aquiluna sp.]|nr:2-C-methyl-D-erythritol 4-phosphate cytidylyltransferase [Aquiluna sp.]